MGSLWLCCAVANCLRYASVRRQGIHLSWYNTASPLMAVTVLMHDRSDLQYISTGTFMPEPPRSLILSLHRSTLGGSPACLLQSRAHESAVHVPLLGSKLLSRLNIMLFDSLPPGRKLLSCSCTELSCAAMQPVESSSINEIRSCSNWHTCRAQEGKKPHFISDLRRLLAGQAKPAGEHSCETKLACQKRLALCVLKSNH